MAGGGGGYGDPRQRPAALVAGEVRNGVVSAQAGREIYGVVVDAKTFALDEEATRRLREPPRAADAPGG
jgi:N-methylhydantoinase B